MSKEGQDHERKFYKKQLNEAPGSSWTLDRQLWSLYGAELGPTYMGDTVEA